MTTKEELKRDTKIYSELKIEAARIKEKIDELNPIIQKNMEAIFLEEIETDYGRFFFKKKRDWEYPQNVVELEEKYKEEKKKSEQLGTATYQEVNVLNFKTKNEDTKNKE